MLTLILITSNFYSEPSDFVSKELINKPVTYMTIGLEHCSETFYRVQEKSLVDCYYNWDENKLEFHSMMTEVGITADDYEKALQICDTKLHNDLRGWFVNGSNFYMKMEHLRGFNPRGFIYKDSEREEEFDEFIARSKAVISIKSNVFALDNRWECEWEIGDTQPSIQWIPKT